jgi:hypothetical protein
MLVLGKAGFPMIRPDGWKVECAGPLETSG